MKQSNIAFSVLLAAYRNDDPGFLLAAIDSMRRQTLKAAEMVLVQDGPVPEGLDAVIRAAEAQGDVRVIRLERNEGLGHALNVGVRECRHDWIARMDADDIAVPDRFEKQFAYLEAHPEVDVLGGTIAEFLDDPSVTVDYRVVPLSDEDIKRFLRKRNPMNHVTVVFRKEAVLAAGNYQSVRSAEDYLLWAKIASSGGILANMPDILVNVRVGAAMYGRRGGWRQFKIEVGVHRYLRDIGIIGLPRYCFNVALRFFGVVLLPNWARSFIYRSFLRKTEIRK